MTRNQKRNLIITLVLIFAFIGVLVGYWVLIQFNPFTWIAEHASVFILWAALIFCAGLILLGYWLTHRKRL